MQWNLPGDSTEPVITAKKHIFSSHGNPNACRLPETCVIFEIGTAIPFIEKNYSTYTILERLPGFISDEKCIGILGDDSVCYTRGGYGAPAAVDTLETVLALGAKRIIVVGMCGGFSENIAVGDVVAPSKIVCEEGVTQHYMGDVEYALPDKSLHKEATHFFESKFKVLTDPTVSTDAVYRQTLAKEAYWRTRDCIGVDMEASAILSVSRFYSVPAAAVLLCSDRHPLPHETKPWRWGNCDFREKRREFIAHCISFAQSI